MIPFSTSLPSEKPWFWAFLGLKSENVFFSKVVESKKQKLIYVRIKSMHKVYRGCTDHFRPKMFENNLRDEIIDILERIVTFIIKMLSVLMKSYRVLSKQDIECFLFLSFCSNFKALTKYFVQNLNMELWLNRASPQVLYVLK